MNYYKRHLGDYARDTGDLTMLQHGAFGLLLDRYYSDEKPLKASKVYAIGKARNQAERDAVDFVLKEYFSLADGLWSNAKADSVIEASKKKSKSCSDAAKSKKINDDSERTLSENEADALPESSERLASHKPLAISHKPLAKDQEQDHAPATPALTLEPSNPKDPKPKREAAGVRLPDDWQPDPSIHGWARAEVPGLDVLAQLPRFRDYWMAKPGADGRKSNWQATFRNWLRTAYERGSGGGPRGGGQPQQSHSRAAGRPLE